MATAVRGCARSWSEGSATKPPPGSGRPSTARRSGVDAGEAGSRGPQEQARADESRQGSAPRRRPDPLSDEVRFSSREAFPPAGGRQQAQAPSHEEAARASPIVSHGAAADAAVVANNSPVTARRATMLNRCIPRVAGMTDPRRTNDPNTYKYSGLPVLCQPPTRRRGRPEGGRAGCRSSSQVARKPAAPKTLSGLDGNRSTGGGPGSDPSRKRPEPAPARRLRTPGASAGPLW